MQHVQKLEHRGVVDYTPAPAGFSAWPNLLPLDRDNYTGTLSGGLSTCEQSCSNGTAYPNHSALW